MDSLQDQLAEADKLITSLRECVPGKIDPQLMSKPTPFPFRLAMAGGGHLNRVLDLAETALALVKEHRSLPSIVIARACLESAAILAELADRAERFLGNGDQGSFNDFLERVALGSRNDDTPYEATNVLTFVDKLNRKSPGFKAHYVDLCEQAHPNWAATAPYLDTTDPGRLGFHRPGEDFELMVPTPILVATKISIDAGERIHAAGKKIAADA